MSITDKDPNMATDVKEADEFASGPLSLLLHAMKGNSQVLINVRNNHKLLARVKAFGQSYVVFDNGVRDRVFGSRRSPLQHGP